MNFSELSLEAQNIFYSVENTPSISQRVKCLIKSLVKKSEKGIELSKKYLEESSVFNKFCTLGVKELKRTYFELEIKTEHRKEFKKYYAEYLLNMIDEYNKL